MNIFQFGVLSLLQQLGLLGTRDMQWRYFETLSILSILELESNRKGFIFKAFSKHYLLLLDDAE